MADHKNQHFTPRILLKPFTLRGEGKAINLYAIATDKIVRNAPVKSQCARDYIYGRDGKIEAALAEMERQYGQAINRAINGNETNEDLSRLRFFAHVQMRRTEMAFTRMAALEQGFFSEVFGPDAPEHLPLEYYMVQSLKACMETDEKLHDLKVRLIENRSAVDFVISDDPAVLTNRYAKQKHQDAGVGLISSGLSLWLPLTPKLCLVCYDGLIYTAPNLNSGRLILSKESDARAINELQYINASSAIYFSDWESREVVQAETQSAAEQRNEERTVFTHAIYVGPDGEGGEIYKSGTKEEAQAAEKSMIHTEAKYPVPKNWFSELQYRRPARFFSDGSAAGHVRRKEWLKST